MTKAGQVLPGLNQEELGVVTQAGVSCPGALDCLVLIALLSIEKEKTEKKKRKPSPARSPSKNPKNSEVRRGEGSEKDVSWVYGEENAVREHGIYRRTQSKGSDEAERGLIRTVASVRDALDKALGGSPLSPLMSREMYANLRPVIEL